MHLKISVAMCTFQGERFLKEQLDSLSAQSRLPDECIICDDGSRDGTREVLRKYARAAPFSCRVEENVTNVGTTANFEKAISLCKGDIIALADQDDVWFSQKLKMIEDRFLASPCPVAIFSDAALMNETSEPLPGSLWRSFAFGPSEQKSFAVNPFGVLLKGPVVTGATFAFRSQYRDLILPIPKSQIHDYWISVLLGACGKIELISEPLMYYRWHRSQQMGLPPDIDLQERFHQIYEYVGARYYPELERYEQWKERLLNSGGRFSASPVAIQQLTEQIYHRRTRANLPLAFVERCSIIVREATNANYWRYSSGWKSIGKDLFLLSGNRNRGAGRRK